MGVTLINFDFNSFMYADDLILLSISVGDLQKLINICRVTLTSLDLSINVNKCNCIRIGPRFKVICSNLLIDGVSVNWVDKIKFLGIEISSDRKFSCDWQESRKNFYKSANSILHCLGCRPPIDLAIKLINSKCVPILMYGLSAVSLSLIKR